MVQYLDASTPDTVANMSIKWGISAFLNLSGGILSTALLVTCLVLIRRRSVNLTSDLVFVLGAMLGNMLWASACGVQCLASAGFGFLIGGNVGCAIEGFYHVVGNNIVIAAHACLAIRTYLLLERAYAVPVKYALWTVGIVVCFFLILSGSTVPVSDVTVMPSGVFCWFVGHSPGNIAFVAAVGLSISAIFASYLKVFLVMRRSRALIMANSTASSHFKGIFVQRYRMAKTMLLFAGLTCFLYAPALPILGYQIITGVYIPGSDFFVYVAAMMISASCAFTPIFYTWQHPAIWQPTWEAIQERVCRRQRETVKTLSFDDFLALKAGRDQFYNFLVGEFSVENLLFLEAAEDWYRSQSTEELVGIYETFIGSDADTPVNISGVLRKQLQTSCQAVFDPDSWTGAENPRILVKTQLEVASEEIRGLLRRDTWKRFKDSNAQNIMKIWRAKDERLVVSVTTNQMVERLAEENSRRSQAENEEKGGTGKKSKSKASKLAAPDAKTHVEDISRASTSTLREDDLRKFKQLEGVPQGLGLGTAPLPPWAGSPPSNYTRRLSPSSQRIEMGFLHPAEPRSSQSEYDDGFRPPNRRGSNVGGDVRPSDGHDQVGMSVVVLPPSPPHHGSPTAADAGSSNSPLLSSLYQSSPSGSLSPAEKRDADSRIPPLDLPAASSSSSSSSSSCVSASPSSSPLLASTSGPQFTVPAGAPPSSSSEASELRVKLPSISGEQPSSPLLRSEPPKPSEPAQSSPEGGSAGSSSNVHYSGSRSGTGCCSMRRQRSGRSRSNSHLSRSSSGLVIEGALLPDDPDLPQGQEGGDSRPQHVRTPSIPQRAASGTKYSPPHESGTTPSPDRAGISGRAARTASFDPFELAAQASALRSSSMDQSPRPPSDAGRPSGPRPIFFPTPELATGTKGHSPRHDPDASGRRENGVATRAPAEVISVNITEPQVPSTSSTSSASSSMTTTSDNLAPGETRERLKTLC